MKAAARSKYGPPEVLSIKEFEIPTPKDNEVLVKVYATTVNRTDCAILWARPFLMRFFTGLFKPRLAVTGTDFAGQIEAVGRTVKSFKVGDKVAGFDGFGIKSHAHYLTIPEAKGIITLSDNQKYDQAAACVEGAFYALNNVHMVNPKAGQKALIYGATGAIGSAYVQLFKFYGVFVTAVCIGDHRELVKSLGADKIIDYKEDDFTQDSEHYDFVFDAVGKTSFARCKPLLMKNGIFTSTEGYLNMFLALIPSVFGGKQVMFRPPTNIKAGLRFINDLVEKGKFRPVIDRTYPLVKIADAYRYVATGQKIGNVIIAMDA